jgi:WD40 repeat protein
MKKKSSRFKNLIMFILIFSSLIIPLSFENRSKNIKECNQLDINSKIQTSLTELWNISGSRPIIEVSISPDGNFIAAIDQITLYLYNRSSSTPLWSYPNFDPLNAVKFSPDGNYIVIGGERDFGDGIIHLFNISSPVPLKSYTIKRLGPPKVISALDISVNASYIVASDIVDTIYLYNRTNQIWNFTAMARVNSISISYNGNFIVAGGNDNEVYYFNNTSPISMWSDVLSDSIISVDMDKNGSFVVVGTGSSDRRVYFYNATNSTKLSWSKQLGEMVRSVSISENGTYITAGSFDYSVYLFNQISSDPIWNYTTESVIWSVEISEDEKYVVAGSSDNNIYLLNASSTNEPLISNFTTSDAVLSVSISKEGRYIAGGADNNVYLFYGAFPPNNFTLSTDTGNASYSGNFNLIWTESEGANNYTIYTYDYPITQINYSLTPLERNYKQHNYSINGLQNGTYYYAIVAHNQFGNTTTNCVNVTVIRYPPLPFNLSTNATQPEIDGNYNLTWDSSLLASYYTVYECNKTITVINSSVTTIVPSTTNLNYSITNKSNGVYYYLVKAFNNNGNTSSNCINVSVERAPSNFTIYTTATIPDEDGDFILTWNSTFQADNYTVYMHNSSITEINDTLTLLANMTTDLNCIVPTLTNGTYYFIVVASNKYGNTSCICISVNVQIPPSDEVGGGPGDKTPNGGFDWGGVLFWGAVGGGAAGGTILTIYFIRPEVFQKAAKPTISSIEAIAKKKKILKLKKKKKKKKEIIICPKCANENFVVNDICFNCSSDLKLQKIKTINIIKNLIKDTGSLKVGFIELYYPSRIVKGDTFTISCLVAQQNATKIKIKLKVEKVSDKDIEIELLNSKPKKISMQIKAENPNTYKFKGIISSINDKPVDEKIEIESKDMVIKVFPLVKDEAIKNIEKSEFGKSLIEIYRKYDELELQYLDDLDGKFKVIAAKNFNEVRNKFSKTAEIDKLMKDSQEINDILILTRNNFKVSLEDYDFSGLLVIKESVLESLEKLFKFTKNGLIIEEKEEGPNFKTYSKIFILRKSILLLRLQKIRLLKTIHDFAKLNNLDISNLNL